MNNEYTVNWVNYHIFSRVAADTFCDSDLFDLFTLQNTSISVICLWQFWETIEERDGNRAIKVNFARENNRFFCVRTEMSHLFAMMNRFLIRYAMYYVCNVDMCMHFSTFCILVRKRTHFDVYEQFNCLYVFVLFVIILLWAISLDLLIMIRWSVF